MTKNEAYYFVVVLYLANSKIRVLMNLYFVFQLSHNSI